MNQAAQSATPTTANTNALQFALITGASGGIGRAIALEFAKAGTSLILAARGVKQLQALKAEWEKTYGIRVMVFESDLSQAGAAQALHQAVTTQLQAIGGKVKYLVNNAGHGLYGLFQDSALNQELGMMQLNMTSLTVLTKRFLPDVMATRGKIMNVASTAAFQPGPYMAVYYASKSYVLSFTEALASELAGSAVTALCPGPTASGFQDKAAMHDSALVKGKKLPSADMVGAKAYRAMMAGKRVAIPGCMWWVMAQSVRMMPRNMAADTVRRMSVPA
jgi:uncharacterized protein